MKNNAQNKTDKDSLVKEVASVKHDLSNLIYRKNSDELKNPSVIRSKKKTIARILTKINGMQKGEKNANT